MTKHLERRLSALERRVDQLEATVAPQPTEYLGKPVRQKDDSLERRQSSVDALIKKAELDHDCIPKLDAGKEVGR
jgi:uncharacterized coiled-coil protein SlyX